MDFFKIKQIIFNLIFKNIWRLYKVICKPLFILILYIVSPSREVFEELTDFNSMDVSEDAYPAFVTICIVITIFIAIVVIFR